MSSEFSVAATAQTPEQIFEGRLLRIPAYQRGYSWELSQWDEFLEDLELLPSGRSHYTGNIVLHTAAESATVKDKRGKVYRISDIVDGQQRLTTIVLLMNAIRRELRRLEKSDLAQGIEDTFLAVSDSNGQPLPRLTLNEECHDFFFKHVLRGEAWLEGTFTRAHKNLAGANAHFEQYLSRKRNELDENFGDWIEALRDKVCHQLSLTVYPVGEEADAGIIFEVMNNRGRPITELDKVKNYLMYLSSKLNLESRADIPKRVNSTWAHIHQRLMVNGLGAEENEEQLLRTHWLMAYHPDAKEWKGSKSVKAEFNLRDFQGKHNELLSELIKYVDGLRNTATAFCDVANPNHPDAFSDLHTDPMVRAEVQRFGQKLPRLRILAPFLPLLMAIRVKKPGDGGLYLRALQACERYAFRVYRLLERRTNAGRSSLILTGYALHADKLSAEMAIATVDRLANKYAPEQDFLASLALSPKGNWYNWTGLKYFLFEYEEYLSVRRNKNLRIDWSHLLQDAGKNHTIEHILPQTPTAECWKAAFDEEQRHKYMHDIGNLCLTLDNSSYKNKCFKDKKGSPGSGIRCYADGDLLMERDLAGYTDWNEIALLGRREKIVAWATARWGMAKPPIKSEPSSIPEDEDDEPDSDLIND